MKLYLRIIYGWLQKDSTGIDELEQALTDSLKTFGFEHMEISQLPVTKGLLNHFAPPGLMQNYKMLTILLTKRQFRVEANS